MLPFARVINQKGSPTTAVNPAFCVRGAVCLDGPGVVADRGYASVHANVGSDHLPNVPRSVDERGSRLHSLDSTIYVV